MSADSGMSDVLRVLLVEDSPHDAGLVLRELERAAIANDNRRVQTGAELERELRSFQPHVILCDYSMPGFSGMEALQICRRAGAEIPLIFVSGAIGEDVAIAALKAGANDYVMKTNLARLAPAIRRELREAATRHARTIAEAGLRRAQSMAKLAHIVTRPDGAFESWSESLAALIGVEAGALPRSTRAWLGFVHPEDHALFRERCIDAVATRERREAEYRLRRPDGGLMHLRQTMEPLGGEADGAAPRWFNTLQDVSDQKRAEMRLAAMARRLVTLQERERLDIARELHDRVGQNLSSLGINLARLQAEPAGDAGRTQIADCQAIVQAIGLSIQNVLTELKPPMLAGYGLIDALKFQARDFTRRTGIAVDVSGTGPAGRLPPEVEMALFRIAQAALSNVLQHAQAKSVAIRLARVDERLRFEISDDGIGFDPGRALASGRWGLSVMRERAEAIDGALGIESGPGRGTRIVVEAPE